MTFMEAYENIQKNFPTLPLKPRLEMAIRLRQNTAEVNPEWVVGEAVVFDVLVHFMEAGFTLCIPDPDGDEDEDFISNDLGELLNEATACDVNYVCVGDIGTVMLIPENGAECVSDWSFDPDNDQMSPILDPLIHRWDQ